MNPGFNQQPEAATGQQYKNNGRWYRSNDTKRAAVVRCNYANYSSLRDPLPPPPPGQVWHHNKITREWKVVQKEQQPQQQQQYADEIIITDETKALLEKNMENDDDDDFITLEHIVLPTDTFAGICLAYRIKPTQLRQANHGFSGTSLKLAPWKLRIPGICKQDLLSGKIQPQDINNNEVCKEQILLATFSFSSLHPTEARAYLAMANGNLQAAIQQACEDGVPTTMTTPIRHLATKIQCSRIERHRRQQHQQQRQRQAHHLHEINMDMKPPPPPLLGLTVVSPMDLPAGFRFVVKVPDAGNSGGSSKRTCGQPASHVQVQVPRGGVTKGETFTPLLCYHDGNVHEDDDDNVYYPPAGAWKDGVCSCLNHHHHNHEGGGSWLMTCENVMGFLAGPCGHALLLGQVQTRNGFGCCGRPPVKTTTVTTPIMCCSSFVMWTLFTVAACCSLFVMVTASLEMMAVIVAQDDDVNNGSDSARGGIRQQDFLVCWIAGMLVFIFVVSLCMALTLTRRHMRQRFAIAGNACNDIFCAACFPCGVVTQMARHTTTATTTHHSDPKTRRRTATIGKIMDKFLIWQDGFSLKNIEMSRGGTDITASVGGGDTTATADESFASASSFVEVDDDDDDNDNGCVFVGMTGFEVETGMNVILENHEAANEDDCLQIV